MDRFGGLCQGFIYTIGHREQNICVTRSAGLTPANWILEGMGSITFAVSDLDSMQ